MSEEEVLPPRLRLKELLAVPEKVRTDEQWDEINELEISLAAGNREGVKIPQVKKRESVRTGIRVAGNVREGKKSFNKLRGRKV